MTENEFLLQDRITKIKSVISDYGEENFYISFSGGKDSTALSFLVDMAIPHNKIPRVYADTGIELKIVRDFVYKLKESDTRIEIIKPCTNIKDMLEREGYPFKSKYHSHMVDIFQRNGIEKSETVQAYLNLKIPKSGVKKFSEHLCPKILKYQFYDGAPFKISSKCCDKLKKEPLKKYMKETGRKYSITGVIASEGGQRESAKCLAFSGKKLKAFQPLAPTTKQWVNWLIHEYSIDICDIYKPPYNFKRTGCKGCPYNPTLGKDLETLKKFFPDERKQCELIWGKVYEEYRRIGYRLPQRKRGK